MNWRRGILRTLAALIAIAGLAGCGPKDQLDRTVKSTTFSEYNFWLNDDYSQLSPLVQRDYDEAYRELSLATMTDKAGLSPEEQKLQMLASINGQTVRNVIIEGFKAEIRRLQVVRADAAKLLIENEALLATPSTPAQISAMKMTIESIHAHLTLLDHQIVPLQQRIDELSKRAQP